MSAVFCSMALPCMLCPGWVIKLGFTEKMQPRDEHEAARTELMMRCFGSQAMLSGIAMSVGEWKPVAYKVWIGGILPFFVFDFVAWKKGYINSLGAVFDAIGNVIFVTCSLLALVNDGKQE